MKALQSDKCFLVSKPNQNKWLNSGARFSVKIGDLFLKTITLPNWTVAGWSGQLKKSNIDGETCTAKMVLFNPFCDVY